MKEFVKKKAVVVTDEAGLPNYMTMFYIEPGTCPPEAVPDMFKVNGKTVAAVLISQYTNVVLKGIAASMPYQKPAENMDHDESAEACRRKGKNWHLLTNTEFVYLLEEAERLGHKISGNTNFGKSAENPGEQGWCYDGYTTLTGLDPLAWSHDGTKEGVFGLCGNFWERVAGLRLHKGVIEYIKNNDAAFADYGPGDPAWIAAEVDGKTLKLDAQSGKVVLTDGKIAGNCDGCRMSELQLAGELSEVPEIIYKLGILPRDWKERKDGIWADSDLMEAVPFRGSGFHNASHGGAAALLLNSSRSYSYRNIGFRSALYLEDWELATGILEGDAEAARKNK